MPSQPTSAQQAAEQPPAPMPAAAPVQLASLPETRGVQGWLTWVWKQVYAIGLRTDEDHVFMLAAGIAFNIITSLVPLLLLLLFALGYFLDSESVMREITRYVTQYIVTGDSRLEVLDTLKTQVNVLVENRGIAGLVGFIGLLWTASALAASMRLGLNRVLRCREERHFLIYKLYDVFAIMLVGLLIFISILFGPIMQLVMATGDRIENTLNITGLDGFLSGVISVATSLLLFYVIFRFMPYQRQQRHIILVGAITSTVLWEVARQVFGFYLTEFRTFGKIYGTYAFLAAAAIWIYYSALVFLIGAEVAYHIKQSRWNARRQFNTLAGITTRTTQK
ncbi:MAG: YihY/virulence factor BrkB family protein [Chlorobi bacterium]|nr:YihY/virulence factor BrkB family protein [Chlorobiota bacterium]MBX7218069.1 YihY/virulence factor BrkB family protein [Candidatus Kapabacteria bacterium]